MKIGDKFKHQAFQQVWQLTRDTEGNKIRLLALPEMEIYGHGVIPKSYDSLDEAEFCELIGIKESIGYVNLDGTPLFPAETYNLGDVFVMTDTGDERKPNPNEKFMLVQVNGVKALVRLSNGNYWQFGKEFGWSLTKEDLKSISGKSTFKKVSKKCLNKPH